MTPQPLPPRDHPWAEDWNDPAMDVYDAPPWDPDPRYVQPPEPLTDPGTPWAGWILIAAFGVIGLLLGVAMGPAGAVFGLAFLVGLAFVLARVGR